MRSFFVLLCLLLPFPAFAALRVVATVPDLAAIAREVGGDRVTVTSLVLPTQDAHFVDARPNLALELSRADMLAVVGLDLEIGWLPTLVTGARNTKVQVGSPGYVDCSRFVTLLDVPTEKLDRAMGDIHPGGNPHYLLDPRNGARVAVGMAERMGQLDPTNKAAYQRAAADLGTRLEAARAGWERTLAPLRGKEVITYHRSFPYLASWLGFTVPIAIEPKPGIPPSPSHVAQVLQVAQARSVRLLLQEVYYPATTAELVASKTGAKLVRLPGGADVATGQSYTARIDTMVKSIAGALQSGASQ
jgi:zinc/manganese transport system substrate-binding protein